MVFQPKDQSSALCTKGNIMIKALKSLPVYEPDENLWSRISIELNAIDEESKERESIHDGYTKCEDVIIDTDED